MSRRKSSNYSRFALPFQRDDLGSENTPKECLTKFEFLSSRDILTLQVLNAVSISYGVTYLIYLLRNDNFLHLGKLSSLYIPVIHTIFEYFKLQIQKSGKLRVEIPSCRDLLIAYLICTGVCHCVVILFGAGVISDIEETFVFSCILTGFVVVPSFFFYGRDLFHLLTHQKVTNSPLYASLQKVAYGSVIGAWFGAFVIPLDWERNWQKWPIPCVIGSLIGFILGHACSFAALI